MRNCPRSSVAASRRNDESAACTITFAPATRAPVVSRIVPRSEPPEFWAHSGASRTRIETAQIASRLNKSNTRFRGARGESGHLAKTDWLVYYRAKGGESTCERRCPREPVERSSTPIGSSNPTNAGAFGPIDVSLARPAEPGPEVRRRSRLYFAAHARPFSSPESSCSLPDATR